MKTIALLKQWLGGGLAAVMLLLMPGVETMSFGQDMAGFWLGVTYPGNPANNIYNYTASLTTNGATIGGTARTANPNLSFGGLAYVSGRFANSQLTFKEANRTGGRNDQDICYWDATLTYDPATESLKGTYTNIYNPPYCQERGGGRMELYRIRLKSGTTYCKNAPVSLDVTGQAIRWYDSPQKTRLLATGNTYATTLPQSTTLYVTQTVYNTESPAVPIAVEVIDLKINDIQIAQESCGRQAITVTATGGTNVQYSLNGGPAQVSPTFTNLTGGAYTIAAKDPGGCQATRPVTLTVSNPLRFDSVTATPPGCGSATGQISVSASGGTGQLSVTFDTRNYLILNAGMVTPFNVPPGSYTLTMKDEGNCVQTQVVSVSASVAGPKLTAVQAISTTCGQDNGSLILRVADGRQPLTYSTDGINYQPLPNFTNLKNGTYTVSVRDAAGCADTRSATITASTGPRIEQVSVTRAGCGLADGTMSIRAGGSTGLTYSLDGTAFQPSPDFTAKAPGSYTALVRDGAGCVARYGADIPENCRDAVYLPTAFSPNGDGQNDELTIRFPGETMTIREFRVFNRWGSVVFSADPFTARSGDKLWDAMNLPAQNRTGSYAYILDVELNNGEPFTYRGTVTILR